jgi:DNA-binding transcriptional LysR family regulator
MQVIFPAKHPLSKRRTITLEDIAEFPLILMATETSVRSVVDAAFVAAGRLPITACEPIYMMTAVAMVKAGLGVTVLPASAKEPGAEPSLKSRAIDDRALVRPIFVIKKRNRTLPRPAQLFVEDILSAL